MATNPTLGAASYNNWDFYNKYVQTDNMQGKFISSETTLIASGYPSLDDAPAASKKSVPVANTTNNGVTTAVTASLVERHQVYPIGLIESLGIQQSKQIQRIFEIGSARSYFIPGRVVGAFNLGRTFFNGGSLLRVLYSHTYAKDATGKDNITPLLAASAYNQTYDNDGNVTSSSPITIDNSVLLNSEQQVIRRHPGFNQFFIDLTSDLFNRPFGLAVYCKDNYAEVSHAFYLENCFIQGHQVNISSGSLLIMEGASAQFERVVPIKMTEPY